MSTIDSLPLSPVSASRDHTEIKLSSVGKFAAYGALCVLLSNISNETPTAFLLARIIFAGLLYVTLIVPPRSGATLLLVISLAGQDIVASGVRMDTDYATASIWQLSLGPINPTGLFFGCLIYQLARIRLYRPDQPFGLVMVWLLSVPIISGLLYGGVFTEFGIPEYISDLRLP